MAYFNDPPERDVIIEYRRHGAYVKVCAIDPITYEEVSIVGDARLSQHELATLAVKKLRYVQSRR